MTVLELPYPTADYALGEIEPEAFACVCGDAENYSAADRTGRLAYILLDEVPAGLGELPDGPALAVCNSCGRIYDDTSLIGRKVRPVIGRYDTRSDGWLEARALYVSANFGE